MTNRHANILFIPTSVSGNSAEQVGPSQHAFNRQLICASLVRSIHTIDGSQVLGTHLAAIARNAWAAKHLDAVEQASNSILALPGGSQLESIARYYQSLCTWRRGDIAGARHSLERVVAEASPEYRAQALQIIGLTHHECGEADAALAFYLAAGKSAAKYNLPTLLESQRMTAVVRSIDGDHKRALADLEKLFPLVRSIAKYSPVLYYEFLNSLAVELSEVGRLTEARSALSIALASPFAAAYPEWSETGVEIAAKRVSATPSVVAVNHPPEARLAPLIAQQRRRIPTPPAFWLPARKEASFQITVVCPQASAAVAAGLSRGILDWMHNHVGPRAPPHSH